MPATVVTDPARPTSVRARCAGTSAAARRSPRRYPRRPLRFGICRGVGAQVPLGHPDAADVDGDGSDPAGRRHAGLINGASEGDLAAAEHEPVIRRRCRLPVGGANRAPSGPWPVSSAVAPEKDSSASWSPLRTSGGTPRIRVTPRTNSAEFAASLVALVATIRTPSALLHGDERRILLEHAKRPGQRIGARRPVASTPGRAGRSPSGAPDQPACPGAGQRRR